LMTLPPVGTTLHARYAEDGVFYPAEVLVISESKKRSKAPVKVQYKGWEGEDAWVSLDDLKSRALGLKGGAPATGPAAAAKSGNNSKAKSMSEAVPKAPPKPAQLTVEAADLPGVGDRVTARGENGKTETARVVGAKLQVQFRDGQTKWVTSDEIGLMSKCSDCGQLFTSEIGRDNHWWDRHVVTCSECGRLFDNELMRDEHWWEEHIVYCKQCGKICSAIGALVQHTREAHAVACKQCGRTCSSIRALVQHARDAHQYSQNLVDVGEGKK